MPVSRGSARPVSRLRYQLAGFTLTRTVIDTAYRMVYPFLPALARGLGVDLRVAALAVTARSSLGLIGPVLGASSDTRGRKSMMLTGVVVLAAGLAVLAIWPTVPTFFLGLLLLGAGKIVFGSSMYAYVGDRVPYRQRGLAIALVEFGWSGSFLVGIPLVGWLMARSGWRAAFLPLAAASLACALLLWRIIPDDPARGGRSSPFWQGMRSVLDHRSAMAGLAVGFLASAANESVNIVYGAWMEQSFGLPLAALGAASAVIGISELSGEGLVAGLADRFGKRRAVMVGVIASAGTCIALPALGHTLPGALAGLFLFYLTFEFTIVSSIPLMSEQLPDARAALLSGNFAAHSAGRVLGALVGPVLYSIGMGTVGLGAAVMNLLALAALAFGVRERAVEPG